MSKLFGTDGIRGIANSDTLTAEMALNIGRAIAHVSKQHNNRHKIVIGKDTRISGYMIESALTAGICSMGVDVLLVGPMPTPGIAFITQSMRADAGIVISASHNPYQDNGIKIFSRDGYKLSDEMEREIEELVATGKINNIRPTADNVGKAFRINDAIGRYIVFCKNTFATDMTLEGMKIVLDCANGATYKVAPLIFSELGAEVITIHNNPDGKNINDNCGSQFTSDLSKKVIESGADIGLAFDGDGDRLIAVDENGKEISGDQIIYLCAKALHKEKELNNNLVIVTPMSNFGLRAAFDEANISHLDADVGDRNVLKMMKEEGAVLGGEQSGHVIFLNHHTTGDGIISALQLVLIIKKSHRPLSKLATEMKIYPQQLVNIDVKSKPDILTIAGLQEAQNDAEAKLENNGRVFIRYSGTQNLCRVMVEGPAEELTKELASRLVNIIQKEIGI